MKKLFVIRHAKSDLSNSNISDFDRPLNHRGLNDSQKIGDYINNHFEKPDKIITSPAKRALTTSHIIADQLNYSTDKIQKEDPIYLATLENLIKQIQNLSKLARKSSKIVTMPRGPSRMMKGESRTLCRCVLSERSQTWSEPGCHSQQMSN